MKQLGINARKAYQQIATASTSQKNSALDAIATLLLNEQESILEANSKDILAAQKSGLDAAMLDRLSLQGRVDGLAADVKKVAALPDPVGETYEQQMLPNGLQIHKCRTPIGVIGVIYEARPNVTIDTAALTIKSGNCAILRGGSETLETNKVLTGIIRKALTEVRLPADAIQFIADPDRELVKQMLRMHDCIDLIIPRGGAGLHTFCKENSSIPVITGGIGICHLFADETVDIDKAVNLVDNAKTQRPTVCNALDTLLVHRAVAQTLIPLIVDSLGKKGVSFRLDEEAMKTVSHAQEYVKEASTNDWDTEWLSLILGIKVVKNLDEAIAHVQQHSSGHSDGILTSNQANASRFVKEVDSAAVYVNASTRFTDGAQLGLGAEVAISTQKLHARGPMGLRELTSYKWIVEGNYHVRG